MKYNPISRRQFLQGAGGFTLALPFLTSLMPHHANAAEVVPKRFVAMWQHYNNFKMQLWPAAEAPHTLATDIHYADLKGMTSDISQVLTAAKYNSLRNKINLVRGLDGIGPWGHNLIAMLSGGVGNHVTIDNILAKSSKVYPTEPFVRALHLRPFDSNYNEAGWSISMDKTGSDYTFNPNYYSELVAFNKLFSASPVGDTKAPLRLANKIKVVDKVYQDYLKTKNSRVIASADKALLDNHMTMLSEVQNRLNSAPTASCASPNLASNQPYDLRAAYKNHMDLIVAALACGMTNVATLMLLNNPLYDMGYSHDPLSHTRYPELEPQNAADMLKVSHFYAEQFAYFTGKMDSIVEANGKTLLDNSLVYWGTEMGDGKIHNFDSPTVVLAGGLQGYFKTGYYLDLRRRPYQGYVGSGDGVGRPYNQLLVTILQGMGLAPQDYEIGGVAGAGNYTIRPIEYGVDMAQIHAKYLDTATRRKPLPFITSAG